MDVITNVHWAFFGSRPTGQWDLRERLSHTWWPRTVGIRPGLPVTTGFNPPRGPTLLFTQIRHDRRLETRLPDQRLEKRRREAHKGCPDLLTDATRLRMCGTPSRMLRGRVRATGSGQRNSAHITYEVAVMSATRAGKGECSARIDSAELCHLPCRTGYRLRELRRRSPTPARRTLRPGLRLSASGGVAGVVW